MQTGRVTKQKCSEIRRFMSDFWQRECGRKRDLMFHLDILIWRGVLSRWLLRH